jgi:hypothetical protein
MYKKKYRDLKVQDVILKILCGQLPHECNHTLMTSAALTALAKVLFVF